MLQCISRPWDNNFVSVLLSYRGYTIPPPLSHTYRWPTLESTQIGWSTGMEIMPSLELILEVRLQLVH